MLLKPFAIRFKNRDICTDCAPIVLKQKTPPDTPASEPESAAPPAPKLSTPAPSLTIRPPTQPKPMNKPKSKLLELLTPEAIDTEIDELTAQRSRLTEEVEAITDAIAKLKRLRRPTNANVTRTGSGRAVPDAAKEQVRQMRRQGKTYQEISDTTGLALSTCCRIGKEAKQSGDSNA
jgi:uncharacterized protein YerC